MMRMVPLFYVSDMPAAIRFYTSVLDFELAGWDSPDDIVVSLFREGAELMLTSLPTDQRTGINACVLVDDVGSLFASWQQRGLDQSHREESPAHRGPVDQTWGTREVYVTDPFGNTLRIVQRPNAAAPTG